MTRNSALPLPPPGTRVQRRTGGQDGAVQPYLPPFSDGTFPVRWDDLGHGALWELCGADDVLVIARAARENSAA